MAKTSRIEGLKELDAALKNLPQGVGKRFLRKALTEMGSPMVTDMQAAAPTRSGNLKNSIVVSTKLSKRQRRLHRRMFKDNRASSEVFVGPSYGLWDGGRHGHLVEFGTHKQAAQPFVRPTWDKHKGSLVSTMSDKLWAQIKKRADREIRKARRAEKKRLGG